ncbi:hypothetical protein OH77DRAFT_1524800 [Trametes cingulata]|nr:hypothetical protein OH77DRAFT_1524800 [Trametes cingulata]
MSLSSLFSSFFPVVHADAPEDKEVKQEPAQEEEPQEEPQEEAEEAEEEEEEPEDPLPALQEECEQTAKCAPLVKHFQHCEEKVNAGEGYKGEDCIEEFATVKYRNYSLTYRVPWPALSPDHMMHCVNGCVAPKLFSKLK